MQLGLHNITTITISTFFRVPNRSERRIAMRKAGQGYSSRVVTWTETGFETESIGYRCTSDNEETRDHVEKVNRTTREWPAAGA
jgi:hypothetical protein